MDLSIFRDFDLKIDTKGLCQFNNEIELPCYRSDRRLGKRIKVNNEWKQVADNKNFILGKILGFRKLGSRKHFCKDDFANYDENKEYCIMVYSDSTLKEYIIPKSYEEMKVFKKHIDNMCNLGESIISQHELLIKQEIRKKINEYIDNVVSQK